MSMTIEEFLDTLPDPNDWDHHFLDQLPFTARKSKDPSTKVGAIITGSDRGDKTRGFNGFPRGVEDDLVKVPERYVRPLKYKYTEHAERNAIYYAARKGIALEGSTLYVGWCPCTDCTRGVIQSGIVRIVLDGDSRAYNDEDLKKRWEEDGEVSKTMLAEAGIELVVYKRKEKK